MKLIGSYVVEFRQSVKVGDLVKYMSRTLLVLEIDDDWVYAIEIDCGEMCSPGRYKRSALGVIV